MKAPDSEQDLTPAPGRDTPGLGAAVFDRRPQDEGYDEGYPSVPVNRGLGSERKRGFFGLLADVTGGL